LKAAMAAVIGENQSFLAKAKRFYLEDIDIEKEREDTCK
jgi:hypothetical protein